VNRANNSGGPAAPADKGRNKQYCIGSTVRRESPGVELSPDGYLSQKESQGWSVMPAQDKSPWLKLGHLPQHREVFRGTGWRARPHFLLHQTTACRDER